MCFRCKIHGKGSIELMILVKTYVLKLYRLNYKSRFWTLCQWTLNKWSITVLVFNNWHINNFFINTCKPIIIQSLHNSIIMFLKKCHTKRFHVIWRPDINKRVPFVLGKVYSSSKYLPSQLLAALFFNTYNTFFKFYTFIFNFIFQILNNYFI